MVWYIVLIVALGVSLIVNIELWNIAKELKTELHEHDGRSIFDCDSTAE